MTLNPDVVRSRCGDIEDACTRLARFAQMPVDTFVADRDGVDAASYRLLVGMEAALTLCYHVSAKHLRQVPEQYAACFDTLRDAGVVTPELADRLKAMGRKINPGLISFLIDAASPTMASSSSRRRAGMGASMFEIDRALEESASYQQIGPRRWRVRITGMVTASAEADTPSRCMLQLTSAVDAVLSQALRGVPPFTYEAGATTASLAAPVEQLLLGGVATVEKSDPV